MPSSIRQMEGEKRRLLLITVQHFVYFLALNATFYIHWILISQLWACLSAFNLIQIRNWLWTTRIQNNIRIVRAHQAISATNTQTRNSYVFWSGINIHPPMVRLGRWWCGNRMWKQQYCRPFYLFRGKKKLFPPPTKSWVSKFLRTTHTPTRKCVWWDSKRVCWVGWSRFSGYNSHLQDRLGSQSSLVW